MGKSVAQPEPADVVRSIGDRTGLTFPRDRRLEAEEAVRRAMRRLGSAGSAQVLREVEEGGPAYHTLVSDLTVGETYFFREPGQFEFIRREAIPAILRQRPTGTLRTWSAGCASGEEAYSLAILLDEMGLTETSSVLGTDLSLDRLARARAGVYTEWSFRGVASAVRTRYFRRRGGRFELRPETRARVEFRPLNLVADDFPSARSGIGEMDVVLCRNVLIYLDAPSIARAASRLLDSLSRDGWLFLGASDPPLDGLVPCEVVLTGAGVAYRRRPTRLPLPAASVAVPRAGIARPPASPGMPPAVPAAETGEAHPPTAGPAGADTGGRGTPEVSGATVARGGPVPPPEPDAEVSAIASRIRAMADRGQLEEAGRACATALRAHRTSAELLYLHAVLLAEAGRHREAAVAARRALYADRSLVVAHLALGSALARQDDPEGARRSLRNAERLLDRLPPSAIVPASGGETASAVREIARALRAAVEGRRR